MNNSYTTTRIIDGKIINSAVTETEIPINNITPVFVGWEGASVLAAFHTDERTVLTSDEFVEQAKTVIKWLRNTLPIGTNDAIFKIITAGEQYTF